jgi:hypothetical protein
MASPLPDVFQHPDKACKKALLDVPGLKRSLASTGLFKSARSDKTNIYLARLSAALAGNSVEWDTSVHPDKRLNVHHISMCCSDDRAVNLEVLTAKRHREVEHETYYEILWQVEYKAA